MKRQEKGLLLEKNGEGIVLTRDGDFRFVPPPVAEVGAEIPLPFPPVVRWWLLSLAAVLAAVFVGLSFYRCFLPVPVAYVALDINPSVELGLDRQEQVIRVQALNSDAKRLIAGLELRGQPVAQAVRLLIGRAAALGYVGSDREGVVLLTVTRMREGISAPQPAELAAAAAQEVEKRRLAVKIVATAVPTEYRKEAHRLGLSPGRYMLKIGAAHSRQPVALSVKELESEGLARLETQYRVRIEELIAAERRAGVVVVPARVKSKPPGSGKGAGQALLRLGTKEEQSGLRELDGVRPWPPRSEEERAPKEGGSQKVKEESRLRTQLYPPTGVREETYGVEGREKRLLEKENKMMERRKPREQAHEEREKPSTREETYVNEAVVPEPKQVTETLSGGYGQKRAGN